MQELMQHNGRNWRKLTFKDDAIVYESSIQGNATAKTLPFNELGQVSDDYEYTLSAENRQLTMLGRAQTLGLFFVALFLIGASSSIGEANGNQPNAFSITLAALGWLALISAFGVLFFQKRRIKLKRIYFANGGYITMYARNDKDVDQIESFRKEYAKAMLSFLKKRFLEALKTYPATQEELLNYLNENGQFSDKEYRQHLKKIKAAQRQLSKTPNNNPQT